MDGELYQACALVAAARQALRSGAFSYVGLGYEKSLRFTYRDGAKANGAADWYRKLAARRLRDIKLLSPTAVEDRRLLAFSGGAPFLIACFYEEKIVTGWRADWSFDQTARGWNIQWNEAPFKNAPASPPPFKAHTGAFSTVLAQIGQLAGRIRAENFSALFAAASRAWVFGGMGSWNDSPPYMAHEQRLDDDYERLSAALYQQIMLAVLYAVNEW